MGGCEWTSAASVWLMLWQQWRLLRAVHVDGCTPVCLQVLPSCSCDLRSIVLLDQRLTSPFKCYHVS